MGVALPIRVRGAALRLVFALPEPVRRLLAGRPIRLDGQELALDAQLLLRLQQLEGSGLTHATVASSRWFMDASAPLVGGAPIEPVATTEVVLPAGEHDLPATLYVPGRVAEPSGLLVFFHGGGWVIGSRASHDNVARYLAQRAGVRVLSVEYRLAPEHVFPAAADDAVAAFDHVYAKAAEFGADPERIAVGGDSAGGNLAAVVAGVTARRGGPAPAFQLLLYPGVDMTVRRRSREIFGAGFFLTDEGMTWFSDHYAPSGVDRSDPRVSPLLAADLAGQAPAYVATAGFDPLRDEGELFAERLAAAGVPCTLSRHPDLIHGYANFIGLGHRFREALAEAAAALRVGINSTGRR